MRPCLMFGGTFDPANTSSISVEVSVDHRQAINITSKCSRALSHLRDTAEIRVLWIDAVCIDQQSDTEKSSQV